MITPDSLKDRLRRALWRHIKLSGSVEDAANRLGIGKSALYAYLSGESDPGLVRVFQWAQGLGLDPEAWVKRAGVFQRLSLCSDLLESLGVPPMPRDRVLKRCKRIASRVSRESPARSTLPQMILDIEDVYQTNPKQGSNLARDHLSEQTTRIRHMLQKGEQLSADDACSFFALVASYGLCRFSESSPGQWAQALMLSLRYFEFESRSPVLTWLMTDTSMVLRRYLRTENSLDVAASAVSEAVRQETSRLYPRALLTLGATLHSTGEYAESAQVYDTVFKLPQPHPYRSLAACGRAAALARTDPQKAADFLRQESEILDTLPSHRQLHRFWTSARVLNETGASEEAFSAYKAAILCGDDSNSDPRDFFLLFEEARAVVGADSVRLGPLVVVLKEKLPQLCEMPEAFLFAKGYLDDLSAQAYERLPYRIEGLKQTESKAGDGECLHPL